MRRSILFVLALAACKSQDKPQPAPQPNPAAPIAESTSGAPGSQNLAPLAGVVTRMKSESAQRPTVKVTAEKLFDTLVASGIELTSQKQVLAATAQASYCALGVTKESIAVAVCEYPSADAARAGKQLMDTRYGKLVPDAVRTVNGTTLLTVANGTRHRDVRDRVLETFKSL